MDSCAPQNRHGSRQTCPAVRKCSENPLLAGRHAGQGGLAAPLASARPLVQALVGKWPAEGKGVGRPYGFLSVGKSDDLRFEQLSLPNGAAQETNFRPLRPKSGGIFRTFGTQLTRNYPPFFCRRDRLRAFSKTPSLPGGLPGGVITVRCPGQILPPI